jgi:DNA-binding NtrC family response regulator
MAMGHHARLIALVNDEPTFRHIVSTQLMESGYAVHPCRDIDSAMRVVHNEQPSAVVIEGTVSGPIDAMRLVRQIRRETQGWLPIVLCSADPIFLNENAPELNQLGCIAFGRPFDVASLRSAIERAVSLPIAPLTTGTAQRVEVLLAD